MTDGMINFLTFHRQGITGLFFRASCILLVIFLSACDGGHEQSSSESGSIAFAITLQAPPATQQAALATNALSASRTVKARSKESEAANSTERSSEASQAANSTEGSSDDCEAAGVDTVKVALYDGSGSYITDGGPWPCSDHKGSLRNVPARSDLRLVVLCEDPDENVRYRGEYSGITVEDGYTTYIDGVTAYFFVPVLSAPADGSYVAGYPVTVEWHAVTGAEEYRIVVSENRDLNDPITDEITPDTRFDLPDLSASTTYYWQVHALDSSGNKGAGSETIWSFTNSGPCAVDVPDVVGMSEADAIFAIDGVDDLSVGDITHECSDTVLAGNVISQQPVAGPAPCGSSVDLVVSTGQPTVPNVVGETHGDAQKAITAAGLVVGDVTLALDDSVQISDTPGTTSKKRSFPLKVDGKILYELIDTPGFQRARRVLSWLEQHDVSADKRTHRMAQKNDRSFWMIFFYHFSESVHIVHDLRKSILIIKMSQILFNFSSMTMTFMIFSIN